MQIRLQCITEMTVDVKRARLFLNAIGHRTAALIWWKFVDYSSVTNTDALTTGDRAFAPGTPFGPHAVAGCFTRVITCVTETRICNARDHLTRDIRLVNNYCGLHTEIWGGRCMIASIFNWWCILIIPWQMYSTLRTRVACAQWNCFKFVGLLDLCTSQQEHGQAMK